MLPVIKDYDLGLMLYAPFCLFYLQSQASICKTVQRMISVVLWVATLVAMLLVFGVNLNTVLVSGAASISALVVALSEWHTGCWLPEYMRLSVAFMANWDGYFTRPRMG